MQRLVRRISILGPSGCGKSSLARELEAHTGIPVVHLDQEYWRGKHVKPDPEEWLARHDDLAGADRWIMDGNYFDVIRRRVERSDVVIILDLPIVLYLSRMTFRTLLHIGRTRPDLGFEEPIGLGRWAHLAGYMHARRRDFAALVGECAERGVPFLHFTSNADVRRFRKNLARSAAARWDRRSIARCSVA